MEFDIAGATVKAERVPAALDDRTGPTGINLLTGIPRELLVRSSAAAQLKLVAAATGTLPGDVCSVLAWRGDEELAAIMTPHSAAAPIERRLRVDQIDAIIPGRLAPASRALYRSHLRAWWRWCDSRERTPWPARPDDVTEFVRFELADGIGVGTVNSMLAAIRTAHRHAGYPDPTRDPSIQEALRAA